MCVRQDTALLQAVIKSPNLLHLLLTASSCRTGSLFYIAIACVAGRRKGGKGSKGPWEYWEERRTEWPARTLLFSCFFRPRNESKNPDWSDFMNYPIRHSDRSAICHSKASVFSDAFIQHGRYLK